MNVALDAQLAIGTATGIGEYVRGLQSALRDAGVHVAALYEPRLDPWRFDRRVIWDQIVLPQRAAATHADLLHCASGTMPLLHPPRTVVTVHDVAWLKVQAHARPYARYYFGPFALRRYRSAAAIAVDSEFSKRELLDVLDVPGDRVHVVYPGVARDFCQLERRPVGEHVVLVPGTVERRKNLEVLIRALPHLRGARIVSVGPPTPYRAHCERLADELDVRQRVEFRGYVSRRELLELYATCAAVAVPSKYEGFGYAAAQAMCAGVPVAVSDRSSLPEVAQSAPALSAEDPAAWAQALGAIFADPVSAEQQAARGRARSVERFAWSASASRMIAMYESTM